MKRITSLFLAMLMALPAYPIETGPANTVLRVPSGGGRPKFGAVDLSQSVATANELLIARGGTQKSDILQNVGMVGVTGSSTNDSLKFTSQDHTALSASNLAKIGISGTTAGQRTVLSHTADITVLITGATWALAGDTSDVVLFAYEVNDTGVGKLLISPNPYMVSVVNTDASATPGDVNTAAKHLVSSALNAGTWPVRRIGWFYADFTLSGVVWEISATLGEIGVGDLIPFKPVASSAAVPTNMETATLDCDSSSSITSQRGDWIASIGNISGGACTVTLRTGAFSSTPICMISDWETGALNGVMGAKATSPTSLTIRAFDFAGQALSDFDANVLCMGTK